MCFYFSAVDSGNASEYEEEIDLDMKRNNAQKMRVGRYVVIY